MNFLQRSSAVVVFLLALLAAYPAFSLDDGIVAVVNSEAVTAKDLKDYLKNVYAQLRIENKSQQEIDEVMRQYEEKGIEQIIDDKLILAASNEMGVVIKPKAVDDRIEGIRSKYPSYKEFSDALMKEGLTISDMRTKIEDQFKGQVAVNKEVREKVTVNPQEVTDWFSAHINELRSRSRVNLNSIFVKSIYGKNEARKKISEALVQIKGGADFKMVGEKYSELPPIGMVNTEDLRPEMKARVESLSIGAVSEIVELENGFYIFKLEGKSENSEPALKDYKNEIYQKLFEEKFRVLFKQWIERLRKKAYVEIKKH